jgi:hypothetical protein
MKAGHEELNTTSEVSIDKMEANPDEMEAVVEHQKFPNEEVAVEIIGALKDCSGDQQQAVGYRNPLKRRTQDNDIRGTPKEPTFEKRRRTRPECNNGKSSYV